MAGQRSGSKHNGFAHAVVSKVAAAVGDDPACLEPPLYDVIDPDALEQLFHQSAEGDIQPNGHVEFMYDRCQVIVHSNGTVNVSSPSESTVGTEDLVASEHQRSSTE